MQAMCKIGVPWLAFSGGEGGVRVLGLGFRVEVGGGGRTGEGGESLHSGF